jgi:hypothetical protein
MNGVRLAALVVSTGGWTRPAAAAGPPACPAVRLLHALFHNGYSTMCGPARVVMASLSVFSGPAVHRTAGSGSSSRRIAPVAVVAQGLKRGTFNVFGRGGPSGAVRTGRTFTGSWTCG